MANRKPKWLSAKYNKHDVEKLNLMLDELSLNTVCNEANCPNIGECYKKETATFLIMGNNCTRHCKFCAVSKEATLPLNSEEPENVAIASKRLELKHIVITSVTRDDLEDGGASHYVKTIFAIKKALPESTIEVLIPDLNGKEQNLDKIIAAKPDVINHNIETVPSLYAEVRPEADYKMSLGVIKYVKAKDPGIITKTGIMLGLGETEAEVLKVMDDLVNIECDIFTIGQYLQPSKNHIPVKEYIHPEKFDEYKRIGEKKGLRYIASSPLVRSSYNALHAIEKIKGESIINDVCRK
ncbi:Lipoyl synthase [Sporomusa silvacetica DSM 10669]|uniref:Lipoyl synthase n=1 Tax=Sporomusa silvacetica DSM 10669 TaxID=1123289 RepID=A0ABZ3IKP4_9FIRM|nr:lipoyl synthase [Sporomusa silvacetica]OZC13432.1 lipoyl synthase [Sporomusa silvacetica DSM 10669]